MRNEVQLGIRQVAMALAVGATAALVIDAALQNLLDAARSPGSASMTPWWAIGRVPERSVWLVMALVAWALAPLLARFAEGQWLADRRLGRAQAFGGVGRAMVVVPLLWLLATWVVVVVRLTLEGTWASEGRAFVSGYYYYSVLLGYAPWAGGGITLLVLTRHVAPD